MTWNRTPAFKEGWVHLENVACRHVLPVRQSKHISIV